MKTSKVIDFFGGIQLTADAFGVTVQAVYQWQAKGKMPKAMAIEAQVLSYGNLKYRRAQYA